MYKRFFLVLLTFTLTILMAVACSSSDGENGKQNNVEEPPQTEDDESNNEEDENDVGNGNTEENESELDENDDENLNEEDNNDLSNQDQEVSANIDLPDPIEMNEQIQHPNGITFFLEKITFKDDHISVDFNAQNGHGYHVYLASEGRATGDNLGGITLKDDTGYVYRYVADHDSERIYLDIDEQVTGTVSFMGKVQDDAKTLTLIFNPDGSEDDGYTSVPKFVFENIEIKR